MRLTFFKGVGLGAAVSALTLTATAALAGTGVGGVFNLGQKNTVNASTLLTGRVAGPGLQVTNTSTRSKATGLDIQVATGKPPLVVNSATEVPRLNAGLLDGKLASAFLPATGTAANSLALGGINASGFIQGNGQVGADRATEQDNGSQSLFVDFTDWDLRGTCYNTGGTIDLVTHSSFFGTMNVMWWGPAGLSTATLIANPAEANIIPTTTSPSGVVIQMDDGTNLTTIIATQTFNSGAGTCTFNAHVITSG